MNDIVKRLRAEAGTGSGVIPLLAEAADEIERLGNAISDCLSERDALALRLEAWKYVKFDSATYDPPPEFLAKFPEAPK